MYTGLERVDTQEERTWSGNLSLEQVIERMWGIGRYTMTTEDHAVFPATGALGVVRNTRVLTGFRVRLARDVILYAH